MLRNDLRSLDFGLGETADMLRDSVRSFAADKIAPRADEIDRDQHVPARPLAGARRARPARHHRRGGVGRRRARLSRALRRDGGDLAAPRPRSACPTARIRNLCVNQIRRNGTRRAEAPISAEADLRRACRRAGDVGAGRRLRRRLDEDPRREEGRPLRPQRQQDVDHQRPARRDAGGLRQDRSGRRPARHHRLPDREGLQGLLDRAEARQARHARLRHLRAGVRGLRGAGRERARRRRRRRRSADVGPRLRARRAGGRPARHHAGLPRRGDALRPRAQAVRPADRRVPADAGQARRHVRRR